MRCVFLEDADVLFLVLVVSWVFFGGVFCFQAEDGIRDLVRSRGLGDVYKRQSVYCAAYALNDLPPQTTN